MKYSILNQIFLYLFNIDNQNIKPDNNPGSVKEIIYLGKPLLYGITKYFPISTEKERFRGKFMIVKLRVVLISRII